MLNIRFNNKSGLILLIVLGSLLVVLTLGSVIATIMLSQSRLTHHQVSRIQAYYAAYAGMNYALEQLRVGNWIPGINCTSTIPCPRYDSSFPSSIGSVYITIDSSATGPGSTYPINITANYTYTQ